MTNHFILCCDITSDVYCTRRNSTNVHCSTVLTSTVPPPSPSDCSQLSIPIDQSFSSITAVMNLPAECPEYSIFMIRQTYFEIGLRGRNTKQTEQQHHGFSNEVRHIVRLVDQFGLLDWTFQYSIDRLLCRESNNSEHNGHIRDCDLIGDVRIASLNESD